MQVKESMFCASPNCHLTKKKRKPVVIIKGHCSAVFWITKKTPTNREKFQ